MTFTLIGQVADARGLGTKRDEFGQFVRSEKLGAGAFFARQPHGLPIHFHHSDDWTVGHVEYLERSDAAGLVMVASVSDAAIQHMQTFPDEDWFLSGGMMARHASDGMNGREFDRAMLFEVSLTRSPAAISQRFPVRWWPAESGGAGHLPINWQGTVQRHREAMAGARYRMAPEFLEINDLDPRPEPTPGDNSPPAPVHTAPRPAAVGPARRRSFLTWHGREVFDQAEAEALMGTMGYALMEGQPGHRSWVQTA